MKLVRDRIPEIINADGKWCLTRTVHDVDEHMVFLKEKIAEETDEFLADPCYEEAADMLEVIKAFCHLNNLEWDIVVNTARKKEKSNGGFRHGIILQKVGE
jgi:predicted house-cleaning noncanonical NTP pyrophosphatase (MazG superfamily)